MLINMHNKIYPTNCQTTSSVHVCRTAGVWIAKSTAYQRTEVLYISASLSGDCKAWPGRHDILLLKILFQREKFCFSSVIFPNIRYLGVQASKSTAVFYRRKLQEYKVLWLFKNIIISKFAVIFMKEIYVYGVSGI